MQASMECPFCGGRYETFLPFGLDEPVLRERLVIGGGRRPHAMCPFASCSSLDRERLVYLFLLHRTDVFTSAARVLHVAPEGSLSQVLNRRPCYIAADLIPSAGIIEMDITDIQFPDASFDVIVCNHVLEHVLDDRRAMRELHRVLQPPAFAILQVPIAKTLATTFEAPEVTDPWERARVFGQRDHVRMYGADYPERLRAAGFGVEIRNARGEFGDAVCDRYGICKEENIYFSRRLA